MLSICKITATFIKTHNKSVCIKTLVHKPYIRTFASLKNEDTENILKPIDDLSCIELRARLKCQGLIQTGLKNVLVERLKSPNKDDYRRVKKNETGLKNSLTCRHIAKKA
jgi:hypothetical protein